MPIRRLRALSACSKTRLVVLERKLAAVRVLEPPALVLEVAEELQHQRAREPDGVEGIGAAHVFQLALERRDGDRARPAAVALLARPADLGAERKPLAVGTHCLHLELRHQVLHQRISAPSCDRNLPVSAAVKRESTVLRPCTEASGDSGAFSPPMSVRTHPGLSATTTMPRLASVTESPLASALSAALLVASRKLEPLASAIEP